MNELNNNEFVMPGDYIGLLLSNIECGIGVYTKDNKIISSLVGKIVYDNIDEVKKRINVINPLVEAADELVIQIGI
jgi:exosome complex RNA-binding protein Csl4